MAKEMSDSDRLAIISNVGIGLRDVGRPVLWFDVMDTETSAALQVLEWDDAAEIIKDYKLYEVHSLNGKPCWVAKRSGMMIYSSAWMKTWATQV